VRLRELLVGVEGLALLRHLYDGRDADADRRLAEVRALLDDERYAAGDVTEEVDARTGYGVWSERYDDPGNPIVGLEEPVVRELVGSLPPGRTLDAACGTGRHAAHLAARGHDVVGVDATPEMLVRAGANVPSARFVEGDLRALPLASATFDLVVCGLALAHLADLVAPVQELARVARPGGRVVVSVLHPMQAQLGWHAPFEHGDGRRGFVREHPHRHGDYFDAFRSAGLEVRRCVEPVLTAREVASKRRAHRAIPEATAAAYVGLPAVLVWEAVRP